MSSFLFVFTISYQYLIFSLRHFFPSFLFNIFPTFNIIFRGVHDLIGSILKISNQIICVGFLNLQTKPIKLEVFSSSSFFGFLWFFWIFGKIFIQTYNLLLLQKNFTPRKMQLSNLFLKKITQNMIWLMTLKYPTKKNYKIE